MGIGIAIAAIATAAAIASDIAFAVETEKRQKRLKDEISKANNAQSSAKTFYNTVYVVVQKSIDELEKNTKTLPKDVVDEIDIELKVDLDEPEVAVTYAGYAVGGTAIIAGSVSGITSAVVKAGKLGASALKIVSNIGKIAGRAGTVLAVVGLGFSLYSGITQLKELDNAIDDVVKQRRQFEGTLAKMQQSLDPMLRSMNITAGNYGRLAEIAKDWTKLSENFKKYSNSFYLAMKGYAMGKTKAAVRTYLANRNAVALKDSVLLLAQIIQKEIFDFMREGKTDDQIVDYFANEHPNEGLRFVLDRYFLSNLRDDYF